MSLVATLTQPLRSRYSESLDQQENRLSQYGVKEHFIMDTPNLLSPDDIATARNSSGNTASIPVINDETMVIGNTRTCTQVLNANTSALVTIAWTTYSFGFQMWPGQFKNNDLGYQDDFDKKLMRGLKRLAAAIDSQCVALLEADKSTVVNSGLVGVGAKYGALVGDAIQVTAGQGNLFFNDLSTIMSENDHYGDIKVAGSTGLQSVVNYSVNQGETNATNSRFQFGPYAFAYSNRVVNGAGIAATGYAMPEGSVALLTRNTPDEEAGSRAEDGTEWGVSLLPIVNLPLGTKVSGTCDDGSALQGGSQTQLQAAYKQSFQFSIDVGVISAYNSDTVTKPGSIFKFEIAQ